MSSPPSKPNRARTSSAWVIDRPPVVADGAVDRGEQLGRGLQLGRGGLEQRVSTSCAARWTARPATVVDRLAPVDRSYGRVPGVGAADDDLADGRAGARPAAICAITVRAPWPSSVVPTRTVTEPSGPIRTVAIETGWAPAASRPTDTPRPRRFGPGGRPRDPRARGAARRGSPASRWRRRPSRRRRSGRRRGACRRGGPPPPAAAGSGGGSPAGPWPAGGPPRPAATPRSTAGGWRRTRGRSRPGRCWCRRSAPATSSACQR